MTKQQFLLDVTINKVTKLDVGSYDPNICILFAECYSSPVHLDEEQLARNRSV